MLQRSQMQKKIINALAHSQAAAFRELLRETNDAEEKAYIRRVAEHLKIDLSYDYNKKEG